MSTLTISSAVEAVRALSSAPLDTPEQLDAWYQRSRELKNSILASNLWDEMPHFIAHYLDDADIRAKSPESREWQQRELDDALSQWRQRAV